VSIGTLLAFVIVSVGILVLRVREPKPAAGVQDALGLVRAPAGALSAAYLMKSLPPSPGSGCSYWFVIGMVIYFSYGSGVEARG